MSNKSNDKFFDDVDSKDLLEDIEQSYRTFIQVNHEFMKNVKHEGLVTQLISDNQDLKITLATIVRLKNNLPE